jgi:polyisoprenoid-binding protein YceI
MRKTLLLTWAAVLFSSSLSGAGECRYEFLAADVKVGWTAFKTAAKAPVNGSFRDVSVQGPTQGPSIPAVLRGLKAKVNLTSVDTGATPRDENLKAGFFNHIRGEAEGRFNAIHGEEAGTLNLDLRFNGISRKVPMTYSYSEAVGFKADGTMDILKFQGKKPLRELEKVCGELHKGSDGVSKTWSTVEIHLTAPAKKICP